MRKLWMIPLLFSFVFSQNVVVDFFKYSTVYAGFNLSSPKWEDDRYRLQLIDPETGQPDWQGGTISVHKEDRELDPDFDFSFGLRKIARFHYEPKRGVKNAGVGGDWYKGNESSPNDAATIGRVKGFEYLVKYEENRRWDEKFTSQEYNLRYLGDWFIAKIKYHDLQLEDIKYSQADLRYRKEFLLEDASLNLSVGIGAREHPVYGFAPTVIDTSWYTGAWWEFAADEFGVEDKFYWGDTDGDGQPDGGMSIYDAATGEVVGWVGQDFRWFDANGELMAMSDREFYQYHFPGLLENWFEDRTRGLGNQKEISLSFGLDYYKYTENFWIHAWGTLFPIHYGLDKYSFHNAFSFKEHEERGGDPLDFEFKDAEIEQWNDYDFGAVIGFKLKDNLGFYAEGKYLYYWERPTYDVRLGLNYQFVQN